MAYSQYLRKNICNEILYTDERFTSTEKDNAHLHLGRPPIEK